MYSDYVRIPLNPGKYHMPYNKEMVIGEPFTINVGNEVIHRYQLRIPFLTKDKKCDDIKTVVVERIGEELKHLKAIPRNKYRVLGTVENQKGTDRLVVVLVDYEI